MIDREIVVSFVYPPIPIRDFDYFAHFDGDEPSDSGSMIHGYGKTPLDAIRELLDREDETDG